MDCSNARLMLHFRGSRGDELAQPEREELEAHLAVCPMCRALEHDQVRFDEFLGRTLRETEVPMPVGLRERLLDAVVPPSAVKPRRWLRRAGVGLGLATAASLGLMVWAWYFWQGPMRPVISPREVQMAYVASSPRDAASVNRSLRALGAPRCAPEWANYNYLTGAPALAVLPGHAPGYGPPEAGKEDKGKVKVPQLIFTQGRERVLLFIIPNRNYRIEDEDTSPYDSFNVTVETSPSGAYTYLILYTGQDWGWIKRPDASP